MVDFYAFDSMSLAGDEVSHMPYGHCVVAAEVGADFMGEEVVDLLFPSELRGEVLGGDPDLCWRP